MLSGNDSLKRTEPAGWIMPVAWCAVTTVIVAAGLTVPFEAGPRASGFDYLFVAGGYDTAFVQALAIYAVAAAALGGAFMFIPKATTWRFRKGMAWATFMLMVLGGVMMLIVPQFMRWLVAGSEGPVTMAAAWSVAWMDAGARIAVAGVLVALATFLDAWLHRA
ncbi:MAG TPA: hypothetical protein VIA80_14615 [Hyphomonadaceae bacterium]|jgi:hypothetical protein